MPARKRDAWLDKVRAMRGRLERITREVDADDEPLSAIYRRYRLERYCAGRTFREWAGARRRKIREYEAARRRARFAARGGLQVHGAGAPGGDGPSPEGQQCGNTAGILHAGPVPTASGE